MNTKTNPNPQRGEIWQINLEPTTGDEIGKSRPCLVVGRDGLAVLDLRIVAPITEWKPRFDNQPWMVKLTPNASNGLTKPCVVDCLQVRSVSVERFERRRGNVSSREFNDIKAAIALVFGLKI